MHVLSFRPVLKEEYPLAESFKRATFQDNLGTLLTFEEAFAPPNPSYTAFIERVQAQNPHGSSFAMVAGEIVGIVEFGIRRNDPPTEGFLFNIYLRPEWRGKKLGKELEAYAMDHLKAQGCTRASLRTNSQKAPVVAFYNRMGWQMGASCTPPEIVYMHKSL